jgi:hypothetical protein
MSTMFSTMSEPARKTQATVKIRAIWTRVTGDRLRLLVAANLVAVAVLWVIALARVDRRAMTDLGLVSVLPVEAFVALVLLTAGFVLAVTSDRVSTRWDRAHIVSLVVLLHSAPPLLYGSLRYAWAWKHVGIVEFIDRVGTVDRSAPTLEIYHNWPGFFSLNAMLTETFGLDSPLSYAAWMPLVFNLLFVAVLAHAMRSLTMNQRLISVALWIYVSTAWVGQDYFAPQALAFLLYLAAVAVVLRYLRTEPAPETRAGRLTAWLTASSGAGGEPSPETVTPRARSGALIVLTIFIATIASSHQLTPVMLTLALGLLAVFRLARPVVLPLLVIAVTAGWAFGFGGDFVVANIQDVIEEFGSVQDNVSGSLISLEQASAGQVLVAATARALSAASLGLGVVAGIWSLWRRRVPLATSLLAAAPLLALALSAYGDEVLFRVYLFTMPFAALLAARLLVGVRTPGLVRRAGALLIAGALLAGFMIAHYGNDRRYTFTEDEVAATEFLYSTAPPGSMIIEGSRNYPSLWLNYEQFTYVPIDREPWATRERIVDDPVASLSDWLDNDDFPAVYLLITRSQIAETEAVGSMPGGGLAEVEAALLSSPQFQVVYANADAAVFVLDGRAAVVPGEVNS